MMDLLDKVRGQILREDLFAPGERVLVALSGGADSVSLLLALKELDLCQLAAAHVNHGLRGEESDGDEQFCRDLCREQGIPFFCARINVAAAAAARHLSLETAARDERYAFLSVTAAKLHAKVATAHTANDNLETILFHMGRGCGTAGLCGIPAKRGDSVCGTIVRPLLTVTREEVEAYLAGKGQDYRTDSTNLTDNATRNRLRHHVVPAFLDIFPDGLDKITRMSALVSTDETFIRHSAEALLAAYDRIGIAAFVGADVAVSSRAAMYLCERLCGRRPENVHIAAVTQMILTGRGECALPGGTRLILREGRILRVDRQKPRLALPSPIPLKEGEYPLWDGWYARVTPVSSTKIYPAVHKNATYTFLSHDILSFDAVFRTRREGDHITFPRRKVTKSLKKWFNEAKIPQNIRERLPLLALGNDVLLIPGADTVSPSATETSLLLVELINTKEVSLHAKS